MPIPDFLINIILPGLAGGVGCFLLAMQRGHYRNDHRIAKFFVEILGAMITASFLSILLPSEYQMTSAFIIGFLWATILQIVRKKITAIIETALTGEL